MKSKLSEIEDVLEAAKILAKKYRDLTGKPLGITGEVAEVAAAKLLHLELSEARHPGYDAIRKKNGVITRIQIKGRCQLPDSNPGQRIGRIRLDRKWDSVVLVLLDSDLEPLCIYEATRAKIRKALLAPGSKARNVRGALGVNKFKSIGHPVWERTK